MLKKCLYIVTTLVLLQTGFASLHAQYRDHRNRKVDSLERVLATNPPAGKDLALIYLDLMWGYKQTDRKKSMDYARKCIEIAIPTDGWMGVAECYTVLGLIHYETVQYDSAAVYYGKAMEAVERMRDFLKYTDRQIDIRLSVIYGNMGNMYNMQGLLHEAVEYYIRALRLFEKHDAKESRSIAHNNIGEIYMAMDNLAQAKGHFLKADSLAQLTGDSLMIAYVKQHLGSLYLNTKEYEKALRNAEAAYGYFSAQSGEETYQVAVLNTLAGIYLEGYNDIAQAEAYVRRALELMKTNEVMAATHATSLSYLAGIYLRRGEWRKAEQTALEALAIDDKEFTGTLSCYEALAKAYGKLGDSDRAWEYFDKHNALQSSWATKHYQTAIREMEAKYDTEKKEAQIASLETQNRLITWLGIAAGSALLLAVAAFVLLWLWTVQKRRLSEQKIKQLEQEKQLVATQAVFDGEIQERTRLARDLHDGLGGLLSAAKLHLNEMKKDAILHSMDTAHFDKAVEMLDESMNEMRRVAHHLMPDALSRFGLKTALSDFCNSIPMAEFVWFGDGRRLNLKLEEMVYRIAYELVNNALKHSGAPHILVQIVQQPDRLALTVEDNGVGFNLHAVTAGVGLANIRTRVASFGGTIDMRSSAENGTETNIEFELL